MIELRILGGARAGTRVRVSSDVVLIGRHPSAQLRLDPERDLDVSTRHAELRQRNGEWFIADLGSTNGTFMNGVRVEGEWMVQDGDTFTLGPDGLAIEVHTTSATAEPVATNVVMSPPRSSAPIPQSPVGQSPLAQSPHEAPPHPPRRPTAERIAIAVRSETARLRQGLIAVAALLVVGIGTAYWVGHRESSAQLEELRKMLAENDASSSLLRARMAGVTDTAVLAAIGNANVALRERMGSGKLDDDEAARLKADIVRSREAQRALGTMDITSVNARNAPATAFLVAELGGKPYAGTAFAITPQGLMVTNRHLVQTESGAKATRIAVKFRDTKEWIAATVVKVGSAADDDLALIQLDGARAVPAVSGISSAGMTTAEGSPVVLIGYPLGMDTRMEGTGEDFVAKSTLFPGTVSKRLSTLTQIAAWAGHGSSGSPVLDASGRVVGVVWGGPRDSNGQLVYAVPGDRLAAFVRSEAPSVVR